MPTRGRDITVKEKRGRSPLLPRKFEIGQHTRVPIPPTLETKKASGSTVSRKIPIYEKHTVSSTLYALNTIKHPYVDNTKLVPRSKVMSLRSMFNEKKVTNSYKNTTGSTKSKDARKPHIVHDKKLTKQPTENKMIKNDHNIVTHEEDDKTIVLVSLVDDDNLTCEVSLCEPSVPTCDENINIDQHIDDDQPNKISDHGSDGHQSQFEVDQENQEQEDEQVVQEVEHKDMELEELGPEGPEPKEPDIADGEEIPKEEERVVIKHEVVAHGKKDTAAYNNVTEVILSELQQQRRNRVKALVGAFENVFSLECDTFQRSIKQH